MTPPMPDKPTTGPGTIANYLAVCTAVSLYQYNVDPIEKAKALWEHFDGACAEMDELLRYVESRNWATEMPAPTAAVFVSHALKRYGREAMARTVVNLQGMKGEPESCRSQPSTQSD